MTIEDQIKDEKIQYDINREAAKFKILNFKLKILKLINMNTLLVKKYYY